MNSLTCYSNVKPADAQGLYIHTPFCDGKCPYCAFYSVPFEAGLAESYLNALVLESSFFAGMQPKTVYIGGGTPSLLPIKLFRRFLYAIRNMIGNASPCEWTIEINPGSAAPDLFAVLADFGVTRLSIGAQAFDDNTLRKLGRRHAVRENYETFAQARAAGFKNIGLDLIASAPGVSDHVWLETLRRATDLLPEHLSVYALTMEEGSRLAARVKAGVEQMGDEDDQLRAIHTAERLLRQNGFKRYEISNYARHGMVCAHNISCWRGENYIGLGPSASSRMGLQRWTNRPDLMAWMLALQKGELPPADFDPLTLNLDCTERLVFGLRMAEGVPADLALNSLSKLRSLQHQGLVRLNSGRWRLTSKGCDFADFVALELMP